MRWAPLAVLALAACDFDHAQQVFCADGRPGCGCPEDGGRCQLAWHQANVKQIAVLGGKVYWAQDQLSGAVLSTETTGTGGFTALASDQSYPDNVVVDGTNVYWSAFGTPGNDLFKKPLAGGDPTNLGFAQYVRGVAVSEEDLFYADIPLGDVGDGGTDGGEGGSVGSWPLSGTSTPGPVIAVGLVSPHGSLFYSDGGLYFSDEGHGDIYRYDTRAKTDPVTLATVSGSPTFLIAYARGLLYSDDYLNGVWAADADGTHQRLIAGNLDSPLRLASDDDYVYWTEHRLGGRVMKAPLDGGPEVPLAENEVFPSGIAVEGDYVFWSNEHDDGGIFRVHK